jgi:hypothetical protein
MAWTMIVVDMADLLTQYFGVSRSTPHSASFYRIRKYDIVGELSAETRRCALSASLSVTYAGCSSPNFVLGADDENILRSMAVYYATGGALA